MEKSDLFDAVKRGELETVKRLLDSGLSVDTRNDNGATALFVAAESGFLEIVTLLLDKGANPDISDNYDDVPINRAAAAGHLDIVKLLVERGALYHSPEIGLNPLATAAANGQLSVVKYFVEEKMVPVNDSTRFGGPPLQGAAANGHVGVVQYLIEKGADPYQSDSLGQTAFGMVEGCMQLNGITEADKQKYQRILRILRRENDTPEPVGKPQARRWSLISFLKSLFHREKTLGELRGTPEWENEVIKCEGCGHEIGTRRAIREAAEERGWQSSHALGLRTPCPSCGRQLWIIL